MSDELSTDDLKVRDRIISAFLVLMKDVANEVRTPAGTPPDIIYHYTTAAGLIGILENAKLWVSRAVCLNDPNEVVYGEQLVRAMFSERAKQFGPDDRTLPAFFNAVAGGFKGISEASDEEDQDPREVRLDPFVASFCAVPDLLGQWAYYAREGGYCIGFRRGEIAEIKDESGRVLQPQTGHLRQTGTAGLARLGHRSI